MSNKIANKMEEAYEPEQAQIKKRSAFVESDAVNFFTANKIEKMTIEDCNGNKAKLSRTRTAASRSIPLPR